VINLRRAVASPPRVLVVICAIVALVSPWTIRIPQAGLDATFGFQNPVCWLVVLASLAALLATNLALGLATTLAGEALLLGWFGWAMWVTSTARFTGMDFPFIGIDVLGPGWFEAALGLMATGAIIARKFLDLELPRGAEVWLLAALPGLGLIPVDRTTRGVVYMVLVSSAVFLASIDSPVAPLFQPIVGRFDPPTAPPTRAPGWILLGVAGVLAVLSVIDTARLKERAGGIGAVPPGRGV
jgi:hypothetical protein